MKFVAEFYLKMVQKVDLVVIEAESLEGAADMAEGMVTEYRSLVNVEEM